MRRVTWHIPFLLAGAALLNGGVVHRYSFNGEGKGAIDSIGSKNGSITGGATLKETGYLTLDGVNDQVELPAGLISNLSSTTIEAWVNWKGHPPRSGQTYFLQRLKPLDVPLS